MEKVLLRKLSKKSIIKGLENGYLENQIVGNVLSQNPKLIAKIYYLYEKISFTDDILEELGIIGDMALTKPKSSKDLLHLYFQKTMKKFSDMDEGERVRVYARIKKVKTKTNGVILNSLYKISPNKLRLKNHGH